MDTRRDGEIVAWIGRIGAASVVHVSERFDIGRKRAYARLALLAKDGLLSRHNLLHARPGLYVATTTGLRWQRLSRLGIVRLNPGSFEHTWQVASAAVALHRELPGWQVIGEREFRALEVDDGKLIASARTNRNGARPMFHHPDLALVSPGGRVSAIEVELSPKSATRMVKICRDWRWASHLDHVYYLATAASSRRVERAIVTSKTADVITALPLEDVPALGAQELAREGASNSGDRCRADTATVYRRGGDAQVHAAEDAVDLSDAVPDSVLLWQGCLPDAAEPNAP